MFYVWHRKSAYYFLFSIWNYQKHSENEKIKKKFEVKKTAYNEAFTNFKNVIPMANKSGLFETILFYCFPICSFYEKLHEKIVKPKGIWNIQKIKKWTKTLRYKKSV